MKKILLILKILVGLLILTILVYKVGFNNIVSTFKKFDLLFLIPVILIWYITFFLGTINLKIITDQINKIKYFRMFKYYLLSWSYGLIAPGRIGEFSLVYYLKKENIELGKGFALSILDKLITFFVLIILSIIGFFVFLENKFALYLSTFVIILLALILVTLFNKKFKNLISKIFLRKKATLFSGFSLTLSWFYKEKKKILLINSILTLIKLFISSISTYFIFLGFDQKINIFVIFLVYSIFTILALIPISINGLGIREAVAVIIFSSLGVSAPISSAVFILGTTLTYIIALINLIITR